MGPRRRRWIPVFVVASVVLVASVVPVPETSAHVRGPFGLVGADAWFHAIGYALLAGAVAFAVADDRPLAVVLGYAAAVPTAYGFAMEGLQTQLPTRTFAVIDLLANGVGVGVALLVLFSLTWVGRGPLTSA